MTWAGSISAVTQETDSLIAPEEPEGELLRVPVIRIFDGDGFLTRIHLAGRVVETAVRFGFIDAPEIGQPGGREARDFLGKLVANRWLDLAILLKMDTGRIVDGYGRIVAVPYLRYETPQEAGSASLLRRLFNMPHTTQTCRNIELEMVLNGWAWVLDRYEPEGRYFEALEDARQHRRGIWARDDNIHPWEFKKRRHADKCRNGDRPHRSANDLMTAPCPQEGCSGKLVQRTGKYGDFFGCSQFPRCRYSCKHPS